jgi:hypothetical protein
VYAITAKGRRTLQRWLAEPGGGPILELEALLKVFYGEQATKTDVLANIRAIAAWADDQNRQNVAFARVYSESDGPFPNRLPVILLTGKFMMDFSDMLAEWAAWAEGLIADWPDDIATARPDRDVFTKIASRTAEPAILPPISS